ncbi:hypothetical protein ACHAWF_007263 [Thalassiosira exigua]
MRFFCSVTTQIATACFISNQVPPSMVQSIPEPSKRTAPLPVIAPAPKRMALQTAQELPTELGKYIVHDVRLLEQLGWRHFIRQRRPVSDFASLDNIQHPAKRLLHFYKHHGAPVKFSTPPWTRRQVKRALAQGPHKSSFEYLDFLREEYVDMIAKGQWIILRASVRSPTSVDMCDYSWWDVNQETLPLAAMESMQFGHALDHILREILLSNPAYGPVNMLKVDISDGFYRIDLNVDDIPKLGVAFPTRPGEEKLIAFPLVLPMGWKNSPPIFSTATETIADLANARIRRQQHPAPHPLDELAATIPSPSPLEAKSPVDGTPTPATRDMKTKSPVAAVRTTATRDVSPADPLAAASCSPAPAAWDPSLPLPSPMRPISYIDVFVDDFVALV